MTAMIRSTRRNRRTSKRRRAQRAEHSVRPLVVAGVVGGALGAGLEFLLDPDRGKRRRHITRDRLAASVRSAYRGANRTARWAGSQAYGLSQKAVHSRPEDSAAPNDATLIARVQSIVFRDPAIAKDRVNVNAEHGIVVLRGELDRPAQIAELEAAVREVPGVREVENLLHIRGTPPPTITGNGVRGEAANS
jgi:osmotically-inducible protein OsmY